MQLLLSSKIMFKKLYHRNIWNDFGLKIKFQGSDIAKKEIKNNKAISIIRKLRWFLPRSLLVTLQRSFVRQNLENGIVVYDQPDIIFCLLKKSYYSVLTINPFSANPTKRPKTLIQFVAKLPPKCLSVFDHFVKLALKELNKMQHYQLKTLPKTPQDRNFIENWD